MMPGLRCYEGPALLSYGFRPFFHFGSIYAGLAAWTVGAIGTMTLAVMTRASLGHSGHARLASIMTQLIYLAVLAATLPRIGAAIAPQRSNVLLPLSALLWAAAFLGFGASYAPTLLRRRRDRDELTGTNLPEPRKADSL